MNEIGNLGKLEGMWINEGGIANIVPLEAIARIWRITYDSAGGMNAGHFVIHTDQENIKVQKNSKGMPYIDLDSVEGKVALDFVQNGRCEVSDEIHWVSACSGLPIGEGLCDAGNVHHVIQVVLCEGADLALETSVGRGRGRFWCQ